MPVKAANRVKYRGGYDLSTGMIAWAAILTQYLYAQNHHQSLGYQNCLMYV